MGLIVGFVIQYFSETETDFDEVCNRLMKIFAGAGSLIYLEYILKTWYILFLDGDTFKAGLYLISVIVVYIISICGGLAFAKLFS